MTKKLGRRCFQASALIMTLLIVASPAQGGFRPSFSLVYSAWQATDIVVVTEGDKIDGVLTVLETWKGTLKKGTKLTIKDLAGFADVRRRTLDKFYARREAKLPKTVSGKRMLLFLRKRSADEKAPGDKAAKSKGGGKPFPWKPASLFGGWFVSVAWIEDGRLFGYVQVMNLGASLLIALPLTEERAKQQIARIAKHQKKMHAAMSIKDPAKRAAALRPFAQGGYVWTQMEALEAMAKCGPNASPTFRSMIGNKAFANQHGEFIEAWAKAAGARIGPELTKLMKEELAFWRKELPRIKKGWWGRTDLVNRYGRTLSIIDALGSIRCRECKDVVTEFRDLWRSSPILDDKSGTNQMSGACDAVLDKLPK